MSKIRNPIILQGLEVGAVDAEFDDFFLSKCFVEHPAFAAISDFENNKMVLSGRTGSGKTALLKMLEQRNPGRTSFIALEDMALSYVSNSDQIQFLLALETDLDLFFQALWKHVICLEYIRSSRNISSSEKSRNFYAMISSMFKNDIRKKRGIEYLRTWESKFWITMDENIREITSKIEEKVNAEFSVDIEAARTNVGYVSGLKKLRKSQYQQRAKKIVNSDLLMDLSRVVEVLSEAEKSNGKTIRNRFILIDKLDEKWVDEKLKFSLVKSLLEALKSLRKIRGLKVVVAMRTDVFEKVMNETHGADVQRDKYDDFFTYLRWSNGDLKKLVNSRINYLFRRKYTKENVFFESLFSSKIKGVDPFDYLTERTLNRPRDIISIINLSLEAAQGNSDILPAHVKQAEEKYSQVRLTALIEEWTSAFPWLNQAFKWLRNGKSRFAVSDIPVSLIDDFAIELCEDESRKYEDIYRVARRTVEGNTTVRRQELTRIVLATFYRIGAIGLKLQPSERYRYSHIDRPIIEASEIQMSNNVHVHPMLHRVLGIGDEAYQGRRRGHRAKN